MSLKRQGINPKELENLVELPNSLAHCWQWFLDLNNTRQVSMGASAISYTEMKAYFELLQIQVESWEIEVIKMFDRVAMKITSDQQTKQQNKATTKNNKQ